MVGREVDRVSIALAARAGRREDTDGFDVGDGDTARLRGVGTDDIASFVGVYLRVLGVVSAYPSDGDPEYDCKNCGLETSLRLEELGVLTVAVAADTDDQRGLPTGVLNSRTRSSRLSRNGSARRKDMGVVTLRGVRLFDCRLGVARGIPLDRLVRAKPLPN